MRKLTLLFGLLLVVSVSFAGTSKYQIDDASVDALFDNAVEMSIGDINLLSTMDAPTNTISISEDKSVMTAFLLAWVVGYFGIHRFYLGTKPLNVVLYIITGGGCGILVTVDWVLLLMEVIEEKKFSNYVGNENLFMWQ